MSYVENAKKMRRVIEIAAVSLDDKTASEAPTIFRGMHYDDTLISAGTRINWRGVVKKAAVDLWDREDQNPDNAPTLWADINYRDGYRIIPEVITVTEAFSKGEVGWWEDQLYESLVDSNVYTPAQYPNNWRLMEYASPEDNKSII